MCGLFQFTLCKRTQYQIHQTYIPKSSSEGRSDADGSHEAAGAALDCKDVRFLRDKLAFPAERESLLGRFKEGDFVWELSIEREKTTKEMRNCGRTDDTTAAAAHSGERK